MTSSPTVVDIDEIYIVAEAKTELSLNSEENIKASISQKRKRLQELSQPPKEVVAIADQDVGFITKMIIKIVDNLQLSIGRIHIRLEDCRLL